MLDQLHARIAAFLAAHDVGLLSAAGPEGVWAMPVRYRPLPGRGLAVACLLPAWADAAYFLEQAPRVLLVINDLPQSPLPGETAGGTLRWLQIRGRADPIVAPDWTLCITHPAIAAPRTDQPPVIALLLPRARGERPPSRRMRSTGRCG